MTVSLLDTVPFHIDIRPFNFTGASGEEYEALNHHINRFRAESEPDDPPRPVEELIAQARNIPPYISVQFWAGWNAAGTEIFASASTVLHNTEGNAHLAKVVIAVDPPYRRHGIGRELLRLAAEKAKSEGRRLMMLDTKGRVPAGDAFMEAVGGKRGLVSTTSQVILADLDPARVDRWLTEGQKRAPGIKLGFWNGPYPDEHLGAIAALMDVMNTQPMDSLDIEEEHILPEHLRHEEQALSAAGTQRWTVYAADVETGRYAGSTEVYWNPNRPQIVNQGMTGVFPEFRGQAIGRWLKASMLDHILRERPEARFVRTNNADSNAAMLRINNSLGYKPYSSHCIWQLETDKALAYLGE